MMNSADEPAMKHVTTGTKTKGGPKDRPLKLQ